MKKSDFSPKIVDYLIEKAATKAHPIFQARFTFTAFEIANAYQKSYSYALAAICAGLAETEALHWEIEAEQVRYKTATCEITLNHSNKNGLYFELFRSKKNGLIKASSRTPEQLNYALTHGG